jgi:hypothetical protein
VVMMAKLYTRLPTELKKQTVDRAIRMVKL